MCCLAEETNTSSNQIRLEQIWPSALCHGDQKLEDKQIYKPRFNEVACFGLHMYFPGALMASL